LKALGEFEVWFVTLIDGATTVGSFKKELRWNEAYYHLARGLR
jgi:L-arabinose isomerase